MTLQDIFDQLTHGELSQLSIGIGGEGNGIAETNYAKVVSHINLGLTAIYSRFNLKERRLRFLLQPDSTTYQLSVVDILKITDVLTDADFSLSVNDPGDAYSCFTPSLTTLRVADSVAAQGSDLPDLLKTDGITVVYQANHPRLVVVDGYIEPTMTVMEIPETHVQALLYFVASRAHNPVGMTNEFHAGNSWYAKYEAECERLTHHGYAVDRGTYNTRLQANGWV